MTEEKPIPKGMKVAAQLNKNLFHRDADEAFLSFCDFLKIHKLKVSEELVGRLPLKRR